MQKGKPFLYVGSDSESFMQTPLEAALSFGRDIHIAKSLEEAIWASKEHDYKAIIVSIENDYGLDFIGKLRKEPKTSDVNIVICYAITFPANELTIYQRVHDIDLQCFDLTRFYDRHRLPSNLLQELHQITNLNYGSYLEGKLFRISDMMEDQEPDKNSIIVNTSSVTIITAGKISPSDISGGSGNILSS